MRRWGSALSVVVLAALLGCGDGGGDDGGQPPSEPGPSAPGDGGAPGGDADPTGDPGGGGADPSGDPGGGVTGGGDAPFDAAGFLAEIVDRPIPFETELPARARSTCRSRGVNGPGTESFEGPVPCLAGFCLENAPGSAFLHSIAGVPGGALWAVGEGALLRFDGARWDTECAPLDGWLLRAAYAASASDAWLGGAGTLAQLDAGTWTATPVDPGWTVFQLWGDAGEAFATYSGTSVGIARWDGAAWSASPGAPTGSVLDLSVWGDGAGRVWATAGGNLLTWNGAAWSQAQRPFNLLGVWAPAGGDPWFAGYTFRDPEWWVNDAAVGTLVGGAYALRPLPPGHSQAIWVRGSAADDVWTGLDGGNELLRWDGVGWSAVPLPGGTAWRPPLVLGPEDAWVPWHGPDTDGRYVSRLLHFDGAAWTTSLELSAPALEAVVTTPGEVWAAAEDGLWRFDGSRWTRVHGELGYGPLLATDGRSVWAAGRDGEGGTLVARWDGATVTTDRFPREPTAIYATAENAWIATAGSTRDGVNAVVHHWDGSSWTPLDVGAPMRVHALWASGPGDLWAVGAIYPPTWTSQTGVIAHWDGTAWLRRELTDYEFRSAWGSGPGDVWVSGDTSYCMKCPAVEPDPLLLRWDGARLTKAAPVVLDELTGRSATEVWALSFHPLPGSADRFAVLHRFDGSQWTGVARLEAPFRPDRLHVAADGTLWGTNGGLLRRAPAP
jgi:hypothetical protein